MIIRMMDLQIRLEPYFGGLSLLMGCPHFGPHSPAPRARLDHDAAH